MTELTISHDRERRRFETPVAGEMAHLDYDRVDDRTVEYQYTFVPPEARNRGIGRDLVRHALQWAQDQGLRVVPTCPFVARVVRDEEASR